ncbi:MAG TPA: aminoglycoside phosphotransferase family protein [Ktedonobacteraceae bacterium]
MRAQPSIPEEHLRTCLQEQYDLNHVTLEFLPLGLDYNAAVYRVVSEQGAAYLLKVTSRSLYEPRCLVPRYLNDQGITSVVAPIPTRSGALWTKLVDWTAIVYPFIDGETSLTGMTDEHWKEVGTIFKRIHQVMPPPFGFESLRKETFDPAEYARWVRTFESQHAQEPSCGSASQRALRSSWIAHQPTIHMVVTSLEKLAGVLQSRTFPYVICHADLHARNLIRDRAGHVFVIDWDEVMLAPKERDFIFVRQPQADAFWEGYGVAEIDWILLTYYLWERVVQDLIECAHNVCFRDDWGEEARAEAAQLLHVILAEERGHIDAAYQASAHLPRDLTIHTRKSSC